MKNKVAWLGAYLVLSPLTLLAQEKAHLTLQDAIVRATSNSKEAQAATTHIAAKKIELQIAENKALPDAKISGQVLAMSTPSIDLKIPMKSENGTPDISPHQLLLGQASINLPLYAGGKIKNSIHLAEDAVTTEEIKAVSTKEQLAEQTIKGYVALYKAQQTATLMEENIKRSEQQVTDFKAMEENGLIARNDLLKAELQLSNYRIALQEALKNIKVINYQLVMLLQMPEETELDEISFEDVKPGPFIGSQEMALANRSDVKILENQHHMAETQIQIAKADYLPSIALTGGYIAFGLKDVITIKNAMNIGVGLSYDISSLYKNHKNVNAAKKHMQELEEQQDILNDRIKIQLQEADENYYLAQEQEKVYALAVAQASENYRIVKDKYENGVADTDDLLEADVQQLQSKINQAVAKANIIEKYYDILLVNGQLITK